MILSVWDQPVDCIRTYSGLYVNVFDTDPDTLCIEDQAHALSMLPRFGGHLRLKQTVAQHAVMCAKKAKTLLLKRACLLHDNTEGYLLDMPSPIKARLPEYKAIEQKLMSVIMKKFGVPYPLDPRVKEIDRFMLQYEYENLILKDKSDFRVWGQKKAEREYLKMYHTLFIEGVLSK